MYAIRSYYAGNVVEAVRHMRTISTQIAELKGMDENTLARKASEMRVPLALVREVMDAGRFPVVNFAAGGIATPADAAMMMAMGADGVFVVITSYSIHYTKLYEGCYEYRSSKRRATTPNASSNCAWQL